MTCIKYIFFIKGTGFRTKDNINNRTGGSCNTVEKSVTNPINNTAYEQYNLKLKIHVCKEGEDCRVCDSTDCYSKGIIVFQIIHLL